MTTELELFFAFVPCFLKLLIALFIVCLLRVLELFWSSVKVRLSRVKEEPISAEIQKRLSLLTNGRILLLDTICYVGICQIKNYLMSEGNLVAWPEQFFSLH